jgi:hypothetical protein
VSIKRWGGFNVVPTVERGGNAMARTVSDLFFFTSESDIPRTDSSALYQLAPDGSIELLVPEGTFDAFWGAAQAGDITYFQATSPLNGFGLYGLNEDGTYFYTGLTGTIYHQLGDTVYVGDWDENLWTVDSDGQSTSVGVRFAGNFAEFDGNVFFRGVDYETGELNVYTAGSDGVVSALTYHGKNLLPNTNYKELGDSLYFGAAIGPFVKGVFAIDDQGTLAKVDVSGILDAVPGFDRFITEVNDLWYFEATARGGWFNGYHTSLVSYDGQTSEVHVYGAYGVDYTVIGEDIYFKQNYGRDSGLFKATPEGSLQGIALPTGIVPFEIGDLIEFNGDLLVSTYDNETERAGAFHVSQDGAAHVLDVPNVGQLLPFVEFGASVWATDNSSIVEVKDDWSVTLTSYDPASVAILV